MVFIVAALGFDVRHVIRSILRVGFRNVLGIYLIIPSGDTAPPTMRAIDEIKKIAELANVQRIEIVAIDPLNLEESLMRIRKLLMDLSAGGNEIIISLGGGMRSLIIEILLSSITLPRDLLDNIRIVSDLESRDGYIEFVLADILAINELSNDLMRLIKYLGDKKETGPTEIAEELGIPKTTAWKMLNKLAALKFIEKTSKGHYRLTQKGERINRLIKYLF